MQVVFYSEPSSVFSECSREIGQSGLLSKQPSVTVDTPQRSSIDAKCPRDGDPFAPQRDQAAGNTSLSLKPLMEGLRSQVRALEANTAEAILAAQAESESRLQRRQFIVGFEAEHEEGLALYQERLESMQWQYKLEVDRQCEEQDHFRAARRFHKQNLERLLPPWVAHLDRAVKQCRALGHKDELGWRSQCLTALKQAMQDAMLDTASIQARNEINRVMLDINILQNHEVLGLLTRIRSSYIQHRSDDGTELGTHAANFLEAESRIQNAPVLLPRNQWSDELRGASDTLMHTKSLISTSSIRTGASKPKSMASKTARGIKTKLEFKKSLQDKSPSVKEEGSWVADGASTAADALLSLTAQSSASGPPPSVIASDQEMSIRGLMQRKALDMGIHTSTSEMAKVRMHLVFCANHGDFDSGWEIFLPFVRKMAQFYHVRHPSPGRKQSEVGSPKRAGHKTAQSTASQVPTERKNPFLSESYFELFKLMMTAFKNSSALRLSDSEKVLSLMRENGMAPDVRIYNVMIASCERKSMWRRAIRIFHSMRLPPDCVEPSAQTLEILLSCCRHAVEEPGTIYTLLRKEGLPHEYCYRAALCNAGNRISKQVARDGIREATFASYEHTSHRTRTGTQIPSRDTRLEASPQRRGYGKASRPAPGADEKESALLPADLGTYSVMSSALLSPSSRTSHRNRGVLTEHAVSVDEAAATERSNQALLASLDRHPLSQDSWYASNLCNDYGGLGGEGRWSRWNAFAENMSQTLPKQSPAKVRTGRSVPAFENQIQRAAHRSQTSTTALLPVLQRPPSSSSPPPRSPFASVLVSPPGGATLYSFSPFASGLLHAAARQGESADLNYALHNDSAVTIMEDDGTSLEAPQGLGSADQGLDTQSGSAIIAATQSNAGAAPVLMDDAEGLVLSAASRQHMHQYDRRTFVNLVKLHAPK